MKLGTKFIHAGVEPDPTTGAIMTPIYQTSTYVQEAPAQHKGYEYARSQNPTRTALEAAFAAIENGKYGLAFSSGVAATDAVIKLLKPGDEVIAAVICMEEHTDCSAKYLRNSALSFIISICRMQTVSASMSMAIQNLS